MSGAEESGQLARLAIQRIFRAACCGHRVLSGNQFDGFGIQGFFIAHIIPKDVEPALLVVGIGLVQLYIRFESVLIVSEIFGIVALEGDRNNPVGVVSDFHVFIFHAHVLARGSFSYQYYVQVYSL